MQKMNSMMSTCSWKLFVVGFLSFTFTLLSVVSLLASPLNSHPLSVPTLSWRFSHRFNKGQQSQRQDADIMWFRDPFPYVSWDTDFQIACDYYSGYSKSLKNRANGGFIYARANKRTINFYKYWYMAREVFPGKHDQDVLNKIKKDEALEEIGLRMEFFDTKYISGFCQPSRDLEKVVTMHANCCYGLQNKLDDLRQILADWKKFQSMTPWKKRLENPKWAAPKACLSSRRVVH